MLEGHGIPTVCLSINAAWSRKVPGPRNVLLKYPYGAPFGEPGQVDQQMTVLRDLLWALQSATEPGVIIERPYRWRRTEYPAVAPEAFSQPPQQQAG